jgi:MFS family permease
MSVSSGTLAEGEAGQKMQWLPITVVALAQVLVVANTGVLSLSVGGIVADFRTSTATVQSGLVVYLLMTAAFMILGGKLARLFGAVRVFRISVLLYGVGLAALAASVSPSMVVGAEAVIGLAASALVPSFIALIAANYRARRQVLAIGILNAAASLGVSGAVLVAGLVSALAGWRAPFWLMVALAIVTLVASVRLKPTPGQPGLRIDWLGAALSAAAIASLAVGINNIGAWGLLRATAEAPFRPFGLSPSVVLIAAGIILAALFFAWERRRVARQATPLLSPEVLDSSAKRSTASAQLVTVAIHASLIFALPLYLQIARGAAPLASALGLLAYTLSMFAASIFVTRFIGPIALRPLARGAAALAASGLALSGLAVRAQWPQAVLMLGLCVTGLGVGALMTLFSNVLVNSSPRALAGEVGAVRGTANNLGGAVGVAVSGVVLVAALTASLSGLLGASPAVSATLTERLSTPRIAFVADAQFDKLIAAAGASQVEAAEALRLNAQARILAVSFVFFSLIAFAALAFILSGWLPPALRKQD